MSGNVTGAVKLGGMIMKKLARQPRNDTAFMVGQLAYWSKAVDSMIIYTGMKTVYLTSTHHYSLDIPTEHK